MTALPGTTRDVVSLDLNYHGFPLSVADTAGLRPPESASDEVERIGIKRAIQRAQEADIKLAVLSAPAVLNASGTIVRIDEQTLELIDERTLILVNKMDKIEGVAQLEVIERYLRDQGCRWIGSDEKGRPLHPISVKTEAGLSDMSEQLRAVLQEK